jgi:hypothetical protein
MTDLLDTYSKRLQQEATRAQSTSDAYHVAATDPDVVRHVSIHAAGRSKRVPLLIYEHGTREPDPASTWDRVFWVDCYEDMYRLPQTGRVLVVHRNTFRDAPAA